ncbi:hypothetical protein A4X09_0g6455 [Tilletia walkeri]|uniref:Uncharacterized protein n=1 Tax=Tilletia walkeri TaxID=117179 RepID=A0A8X7N4Z3_9BASI|nr:hypothetical protein A4X09_0g6455 [Tilletia walkeri]
MARTRRFCCCIPTRAGVLILSILNLLGASASGSLMSNGMFGEPHNLNPIVKLLFCERVITVILSSVGFIGAAYGDRRLIKFYSRALWAIFGVYLIVDAVNLAITFPTRSAFEPECRKQTMEHIDRPEGKSKDEWKENVAEFCRVAYQPALAAICALIFFVKLIQLWTCMIVYHYRLQLDEQAREDQSLDLTSIPGARTHRRAFRSSVYNVPAPTEPPAYRDVVDDEGINVQSSKGKPQTSAPAPSDTKAAALVDVSDVA